MKAKEYFRQYLTEDLEESHYYRVVRVLHEIFLECGEIARRRTAKSDESLLAIFNEQNRKAVSFLKKVNAKNPMRVIQLNAFKTYVQDLHPDVFKLLKWDEDL